jgi:hypothetical protein
MKFDHLVLDFGGHVRLDGQERGPAAWSLRQPGVQEPWRGRKLGGLAGS